MTNYEKSLARDINATSPLLTRKEVAMMFRVNPKSVTRWADAGKLEVVRTLGGHRRFNRAQVERLLAENGGGSEG